MIPVLKPILPTGDQLLPFLREIDANHWYSNYGPLVRRFESQLADHFGLGSDQVTTSANATLGISQVLKALGAPVGSTCVMPSWTFAATPAAALWAGLDPWFVDVDPATWLIKPDDVREVARERHVGAVIVVSAFGAPLDVAQWDRFTADTGIPVLIDAAAGFDSFSADRIGAVTTPIVISLHATKVAGVGEGAVILARDNRVCQSARSLGNFGITASREVLRPGINAKMSEYTAAMGLCMLGDWPKTRERWRLLTSHYSEQISAIPSLRCAPGFDNGWVSSYALVQLPPSHSATYVAAALRLGGIETRSWWGPGCHLQPAYKNMARDELPITEALGRHVLGLPFHLCLSERDVSVVFEALECVLGKDSQ